MKLVVSHNPRSLTTYNQQPTTNNQQQTLLFGSRDAQFNSGRTQL